jgi:hypothetical protein
MLSIFYLELFIISDNFYVPFKFCFWPNSLWKI